MKRRALTLLLLGTLLGAQDLNRLPEWAQGAAREGLQAAPPESADAWVLLDRTEFAYTGSGEIRQRRMRLVRILTERGLEEGRFVLHGLGGRGNKVKRLKGWNCRPDNEVTRIDKDEVLTVDADGDDEVTTGTRTVAVLDRVMKGSLVAFESQEVFRSASGPGASAWPMEEHPVRAWELALATEEGWFTNLKQVRMVLSTRNFKPWLGIEDLANRTSLRLENLPPLPRFEQSIPNGRDVLPRVVVAFLDSALKDSAPLDSWDTLAAWYAGRYAENAQALTLPEVQGADTGAKLKAAYQWIQRQTTYKKVYLTPDRGWIPESASEVHRKRYGDCKDLTCLLVGSARGLGLEAYPVLARIVVGSVVDDEPVNSGAFNHVITAIRLPGSLGLAAEFDTPQGRFLLADPTSRFTPLGWLPDAHHGGRVLICLPTGGVWVKVQDSAVLRPEAAFSLDAVLEPSGRLKGKLTLQEAGNYFGFRGAVLQGGKALKEAVASQFDLPLGVAWEASAQGDPWDLARPLAIQITLDHPRGFQHLGSDFVLTPIGLPGVPEPVQKPGQARRYPVARQGFSHWTFEARLQLPAGGYRPLVPAQKADNPFRIWNLESVVKDGIWKIHFDQYRRDARFGFDRREEGVKAAKQDRNQIKNLLEEGLALTMGP